MVKVSIIITCYNLEKYVGRAIRSCISQSFPPGDFEIIVIDDFSKDNSKRVIEENTRLNSNVKTIFLEENVGVSEASNIGIRAANGMYVIRIDGDDFINEFMIRFLSMVLDWNSEISFVYGDLFRVDENGVKIERIEMDIESNLLNHGAGIMFRKSTLEEVGLYNPELRNCEDFDLLVRIMKNNAGYHVKIPFYRYTKHENNMTNDIEDRKLWMERVLNNNG